MTPALEIIIGLFLTTAVAVNTGLLWRIALKIGNVEGKMTFVHGKIIEHNDLVQRVVRLEVKETLRAERQN